MASEKIFSLSFAKVYPCLIAKAQRKGRTKGKPVEKILPKE